jgi:hypothetical protein
VSWRAIASEAVVLTAYMGLLALLGMALTDWLLIGRLIEACNK